MYTASFVSSSQPAASRVRAAGGPLGAPLGCHRRRVAAWRPHWKLPAKRRRKRRSNGYGNYRHQADACHAYQIAKKKGIPEKQIILFMYDDIAHSQENPIPGKVFNQPDGVDVYKGCKASYTGSDVSAAKFLAVLTGE